MTAPNAIPAAVRYFDELPDSALVDVRTIAVLRGVSVATVWRDVRALRFPSAVPKHPGSKATRWRVGDVRRAMHTTTYVDGKAI